MRTVRESDHPHLSALYAATAHAWRREAPQAPEELARLQGRYEQWRAELPVDCTEIVALVRGEPVGHLVVHVRDGITHIVALRVLPSRRGRGIGRALLAPVLSGARRAGREVEVRVPADAGTALSACRSLGLVPYASEDGYVRVRGVVSIDA